MSARAKSQCGACDHYRSPFSPENTTGLTKPFCAAFPDRIPADIWENRVDHRNPIDGDHGVQWSPLDGTAAYPAYALDPDASDTGRMDAANPLTAAAGALTGAMIALIPTEVDAQRLAVQEGEAASELHCTLVYLGEAADLDQGQRDKLLDWARDMASSGGAVEADAFGVAVFNPTGPEPCAVLVLSGGDLAEFQSIAAEDVAGLVTLPEQHRPWIPHVTLGYFEDADSVGLGDMTELTPMIGPVNFDRLRLVFAGEITDIPLGETGAPDGQDGEDDDEEDLADAEPQVVEAAEPDDAPDTVTAATSVRELWDGCPYCLSAKHPGACASRV